MDPEKASEPRESESTGDAPRPEAAAGAATGASGQDGGGAAGAGRRLRRGWPMSLAAAVAVLVVGGGTAWLAHGTSGSDRVQDTARVDAAAAPGAADGAPAAPPAAGKGGPIEVRPPEGAPSASLPGGRPDGTGAHAARSYTVDGKQLTVWFWGGVCETYALRTDESRDGEVAVRVVVDKPAAEGEVCPMIAKYQPVRADLEQPLGARRVVDATTGTALVHGARPPVMPRPGVVAPTAKVPH